ncbi:MAG: hypothetical protein AB8G15_00440 [Saprospiraceae bacterium]
MKIILPIFALCLFAQINIQASCQYHQTITVEALPIGAMLHWTTSSENENAMFKVEKSNDGISFVEIGTIEGAGNSLKKNVYSFLDVNCKEKKNFYRLKQVDFNGVFQYSEIGRLELNQLKSLRIVNMSAVATTDSFEVSLDSNKAGKLHYHLEDWKGNKIHLAKSDMKEGINKVKVNLLEVPRGIYRVVLQFGQEKEILTIKKIATK